MANMQLQGVIDEKVLEGCIAGKRNCQELLYHYYAPKMFGICLRYSKDYHSAEDLLQDGFIKVFNKIDKFRADGSFEGWIKRIFINTAIEVYRKNKNIHHVEISQIGNIAFDSSAIDMLAHQDLLKLIQKLPRGYRTVFNLYIIEGYNHGEIAQLLGISEGTSKSQLARARMLLQKMINKL